MRTSHVFSGLQITLWALGTCCASVCCKALGAHVSWFELLSHCHREGTVLEIATGPCVLRMGGEWSKEEQESGCIHELYFGAKEWPVQGAATSLHFELLAQFSLH